MTKPAEFTKEWFQTRLLTMQPVTVGKCLLVIYDRQTSDEKTVEGTRHHNNRGFNHADAPRGTRWAKWLRARPERVLGSWHCAQARKMLKKYCGQLAEEANAKAGNLPRQAAAA